LNGSSLACGFPLSPPPPRSERSQLSAQEFKKFVPGSKFSKDLPGASGHEAFVPGASVAIMPALQRFAPLKGRTALLQFGSHSAAESRCRVQSTVFWIRDKASRLVVTWVAHALAARANGRSHCWRPPHKTEKNRVPDGLFTTIQRYFQNFIPKKRTTAGMTPFQANPEACWDFILNLRAQQPAPWLWDVQTRRYVLPLPITASPFYADRANSNRAVRRHGGSQQGCCEPTKRKL